MSLSFFSQASSLSNSETERLLSSSSFGSRDACWDLEACTSSASASTSTSDAESHIFRPASRMTDSRAPCPGLNTLANHGYIPRSGKHITFLTLLSALRTVYNISLPLALVLTLPAFILYGHFEFEYSCSWSHPSLSLSLKYTLDLASLSQFGKWKIAHCASMVHPNRPSDRPDAQMLWDFLCFVRGCAEQSRTSSSSPSPAPASASLSQIHQSDETPTEKNSSSSTTGGSGLSLYDLAQLRVARESSLSHPLSSLHEQVALGESSLTWLLFREQGGGSHVDVNEKGDTTTTETKTETGSEVVGNGGSEGDNSEKELDLGAIIPLRYLAQWFGEERIPDGWRRPEKTVGLLDAKRIAGQVQKDMEIVLWRSAGKV